MKFVLQLTAEQLNNAKALQTQWSTIDDDENVWMGNLNPVYPSHLRTEDQRLDLEGNRLVFEGDRVALYDDGIARTLAGIAGFKFQVSEDWNGISTRLFDAFEVVYYRPNRGEEKLRWSDDDWTYVHEIGSWEEFVDFCVAQKAVHRVPARFSNEERLVKMIKAGRKAAVSAEFTSAEINVAMKIAHLS